MGDKPLPPGKEFVFRQSHSISAPPEVVYDILADVRSHLDWGGTKASAKFRLTGIDAPETPAQQGSEWTSTGVAPDGSFRDRSVVTEATRPSVLEFSTDAHVTFKKGAEADWKLVNRYEIVPNEKGSRVVYTQRLVAASALGPMKMMLNPLLAPIGRMMVGGLIKPALRNLASMAAERGRNS